jgi:hypothetical protein
MRRGHHPFANDALRACSGASNARVDIHGIPLFALTVSLHCAG